MNEPTPITATSPPNLRRRRWAGALTAAISLPWLGTAHPQSGRQGRSYRLLLNTSLSGPVAFFLLAQDRGYLRDEGLELQFTGGPGAASPFAPWNR